jgi:hypothetical protein
MVWVWGGGGGGKVHNEHWTPPSDIIQARGKAMGSIVYRRDPFRNGRPY